MNPWFLRSVVGTSLLAFLAPLSLSAADTVEFLNGSKATGTVKSIRKPSKDFDFETKVGGRTFSRTYSFGDVHAVTMKGKRYVLTPKTVPGNSKGTAKMTKTEVMTAIEAAGNSAPDWFASTPLEYPKTLDLSWPIKPAFKGWDIQRNMVHYLYSAIQENPRRWESGIKLVHHCMTLHKSNTVLLQRDMEKLGTMYFELVKDYPRAAFWLLKVKRPTNTMTSVHLAECYWRIGNREMALDGLRGKRLHFGAIKLLGDMGEIKGVLQVTNRFSKSNAANGAFLLCGDALRQAGRTDEAIKYYQRVVNSDQFRNKEYETRFKGRARDSIEAIRLYDQIDVSNVSDGTYRASAIGYAGRVNIEVKVLAGKMESVSVKSHKEKRHYGAVTDSPKKIIDKQSIKKIDATSGATVTSQAIVNATAKALAQGAK